VDTSRHRGSRLALAAALACILSSCGTDTLQGTSTSESKPPPGVTEEQAAADPSPPRTAKPSAEAAVVALLEAERAGNHRASFALLSRSGLATYPNADAWATHRRGVAPVTAFRTESVAGPTVTILVEHTPAIDPFIGLQFARERQIWQTRQASDGWLVDPNPEVKPLVPEDTGAREAAAKWATARQSCDEQAASAVQAVVTPFGISAGAFALCKSTGDLSFEPPTIVVPGPQTTQMVEQFGPGVLQYLRSVVVSGGPQPFTISLVPIGDAWRVIGVND
jgi:hypothetical protein